ncbi:MAG: hypothetical protein EB084_13955 [Proteobacteria bacterium]|nr:hypothetical protein [Pseudomonadota bacterium]
MAHWEKKQAEAALSQAEHQLAVTRRSVEQEVISAFTDLKTYWQQVTLAKETAAQAKEAYQIALVRYREGFSSSIELLNAQDTFVQADQALATAIYNYQVAEVNWRRAISGDYPVALPDSVKVDWEQPAPLTIPSTWPVAPTPSSERQSPPQPHLRPIARHPPHLARRPPLLQPQHPLLSHRLEEPDDETPFQNPADRRLACIAHAIDGVQTNRRSPHATADGARRCRDPRPGR